MKVCSAHRTLAVITAASLTAGAFAGVPASAEPAAGHPMGASHSMPHNPATPTHEVEPLVTRVQRAESRTEAIRILESAGFQDQLKTGRYEKSAAGLTVGFDLGPSPTVTRSMTVVWRGIKPYVRGTADDWKAALDATTTLGGAACALITNEWGSAGCIAVAGTVKDWTGRIDTSAWPAGQCLAINPRQTTDVFIEAC